MEKKLNEMTDEEKTKFFEEHLSPLIRYGYQEAIDELIEFVEKDRTMIEIYEKLTSMMENKRQVNWPKLQNEALSGQEKIKVDKSDTLSNEEQNSGQLQQHNVSGSLPPNLSCALCGYFCNNYYHHNNWFEVSGNDR